MSLQGADPVRRRCVWEKGLHTSERAGWAAHIHDSCSHRTASSSSRKMSSATVKKTVYAIVIITSIFQPRRSSDSSGSIAQQLHPLSSLRPSSSLGWLARSTKVALRSIRCTSSSVGSGWWVSLGARMGMRLRAR